MKRFLSLIAPLAFLLSFTSCSHELRQYTVKTEHGYIIQAFIPDYINPPLRGESVTLTTVDGDIYYISSIRRATGCDTIGDVALYRMQGLVIGD